MATPPIVPIVLTIAGFDPSSGAGVTADIKTIAAHDCYGVACITALTVQSTLGVSRVMPMSGELVAATLRELARDLPPAAIRIGMLGSGDVARVVADFVDGVKPPNVVLDPILRSSSGAELLDASGCQVMRSRLLPSVAVVTPNLDEAGVLTGSKVSNSEGMRAAATALHRLGVKAVVLKGGHLGGDEAVDLLSVAEPARQQEFRGPKLASGTTHGTGCAFATALACNLARGRELADAVAAAKQYVAAAIARAYALGHGAALIC